MAPSRRAALVWAAAAAAAAVAPAARAQMSSCPMGALSSHLATISSTCCGPSGCPEEQPVPVGECARDCGVIFVPFWDECGALLSAMGFDGINEYADFATSCSSALFPGSCGASCTSSTLPCRLAEVQTACCDEDHECPGASGMPVACGLECALVMPKFLEDCGAILPAESTEALAGVVGSCYAQDTGLLLDHAYQLSYEQGCAVDLSAVSATASASCQRWDYRGLGDSATPEAQCTGDPQPMTRSTCCFPIDSMEECEAKCDRFDDANTAFFCPSSCSQGAECCCKVTAEATIDVQEGVGNQWRYSIKDSSCDAAGCSMASLGPYGCCRQPDGQGGDDPLTTYDQITSIDQCLGACEADARCTAVEYRLEDFVCEVHTTPIDHASDGQQCVCYVRDCPSGVDPSAIGTAGASHSMLSIVNDDGDCSHADLFISEVGEGSSNNKYIELYNPKPDSLHMTGYRVLVYHNGHSDEPHNTFDLSAFSIPAGGTFLICHSHAKIPGARGPEGLRSAKGCHFLEDFDSPPGGEFSANGDDAIVLLRTSPNHGVIDTFGIVGDQPNRQGWPVDDGEGHSGFAKDHTLVRIASVTSGTPDWEGSGRHQWRTMEQNDFSGMGSHVFGPGSCAAGGGHRRAQLSGLLSNIGSCPMEQFQIRVQEVDRVCCPGGCGGQLVPQICTVECAVVWHDLWADCQATLASMVGLDTLPALASFENDCLAVDKHALLDAIASAECRTYASPFPFTTDSISTASDGVQIFGAQDTVVNTYHYVTQSTVPGGTTEVQVDSVDGLSAGDVVMVVQSTDDRGSAGVFEFEVIKSVRQGRGDSPPAVELVAPLAHTYSSGAETLWAQIGSGECTDSGGGLYAKGVLSDDVTLAACKGMCETAGDVCVGLQYTPSDNRAVLAGGCTLLALSAVDPSTIESRIDVVFDEFFDPGDDGEAGIGVTPIGGTNDQGECDGEWAARCSTLAGCSQARDCWNGSQCWAMTTPDTLAAVSSNPALTAVYAASAASRPQLPTRSTQLVKVLQATSVHVLLSGSLVPEPWDGQKGGVLALMASEDIAIDGHVRADGRGFRGGAPHNDNTDGSEGETYRGNGDGVSSWHANFGGGGGGEWRQWSASGSDTIGASGGGGGHATAGSAGSACQDPATTGAHGGEGGHPYGDASLDKMLFGSGGGAPADEDRSEGSPGGGAGGGVVILHSGGAVTVGESGGVSASGAAGASEGFEWDSGVGGGGAGGSVLITANSIDVAAGGVVQALGGAGGGPVADWCGDAVTGGSGGVGRVRLSSATPMASLAGDVSPQPFVESMAAAENDGCERLATDEAGSVWTGVGPLTPESYTQYDRYPATSLEDCQRLCELGTVGCREDCNGVLPTASTPNLSPCDSIAYGPTCVTYTDNVLTDSTQTWGFDYWTVEAGGTPLYVQAPEPLGWVEANAWCQQHYFALASVHCQAQQDLLTSVCTDNCWIGLNDVDSEGDFRWSDDSPLDYDDFYPGEPDDDARDADEDFVGMRQDLGGQWNDAPSPRHFVCATRCPGREGCA